jgi:hypothetical protein
MSTSTTSSPKQFEADRDANPTNLYLAIEEKDWDGVKYQAENFPDEARTWIRREIPTTKKLRWRLLPLHAALLNGATSDAVVSIIPLVPKSFSSIS